jgi:hypothetical protein
MCVMRLPLVIAAMLQMHVAFSLFEVASSPHVIVNDVGRRPSDYIDGYNHLPEAIIDGGDSRRVLPNNAIHHQDIDGGLHEPSRHVIRHVDGHPIEKFEETIVHQPELVHHQEVMERERVDIVHDPIVINHDSHIIYDHDSRPNSQLSTVSDHEHVWI